MTARFYSDKMKQWEIEFSRNADGDIDINAVSIEGQPYRVGKREWMLFKILNSRVDINEFFHQ